ncbi:sensor histidine kinase [Ohtaekwangia sp.]|uniref:sensor histidine kinase n=1 Tax=Ohtaekwangia sp. TaxID=2066019 RepID=UPI002FDCB023
MLKRFSIQVVIRIVLLAITIFVLAWVYMQSQMFFNAVTLTIIFILQLVELFRYINSTNRELARFFLSVLHGDFVISIHEGEKGKSFRELESSMLQILDAYKQVKIEKEAQYQFLQLLINQLPIGIVSIEGNEIALMNASAEKLLEAQGTRNLALVEQRNPWITTMLGEHGSRLIELKRNYTTTSLAVQVSSSRILDKNYTLITLQDIHSEIEQKEIEAWHKLIRILTHEIMNSVTPIASLTETMQSMLTEKQGQLKPVEAVTTETLGDIRFSLNTIHKRSEGLLNFVEKYRALTRVPKPVLQPIMLMPFLKTITTLMEPELKRQHIHIATEVEEESLYITADSNLIEQVIINLITNSIYALRHTTDKMIILRAYRRERHVVMEVYDNGAGIREKEMSEIFIPFFSTRKEGSGIGLSLSKQIMSLHGGNIQVTSTPGEKTSFYLLFKGQ